MLLITAKTLVKHKNKMKGNVKFVFQPCEEAIPCGAKAMIDNGALTNPQVDAAFGIHLTSGIPTGTIGIREGAMMAAGDKFVVDIIGVISR
jgi:amidohydrolase